MAVNVEVKARVAELESLRGRVEPKSDTPGEVLQQEDVFFRAPSGRLKLRILAPDYGELIHYHRADRAGPKQSVYTRTPTQDPAGLRRVLCSVLEVVGMVRKERRLYRLGQTRVHLDRVEGLGDFLELEVVLHPGQTVDEGARIAQAILLDLGISADQLIEGAYLDLLHAGERSTRG